MELKIQTLDVVVNSGIKEPELIPYDYLGFFKKKTTSKGLIDRCEYYREFDGENYSDLFVDVLYSYDFDGVVYTGSTTTVKWIDIEENIGHEKVFVKAFTIWEKRNFGKEKRQNILSTAEFHAIGLLTVPYGIDLMGSLAADTKNYIDGYPPSYIVAAINAKVGVKPYLTQPIADSINAILSDI